MNPVASNGELGALLRLSSDDASPQFVRAAALILDLHRERKSLRRENDYLKGRHADEEGRIRHAQRLRRVELPARMTLLQNPTFDLQLAVDVLQEIFREHEAVLFDVVRKGLSPAVHVIEPIVIPNTHDHLAR